MPAKRAEKSTAKPAIILCADDFGLSGGVTRAIEELARNHHLSATSAIVTYSDWPHHATRLANLRNSIAIGLHLNLTLGAPLGTMPSLAPEGILPTVRQLIRKALTRQLRVEEIQAEIARQLHQFRETVGHLPDTIDGHQHVHALPVVREALIRAVHEINWLHPPLIRAPSDTPQTIIRRHHEWLKALVISTLALGFRKRLIAEHLPTNDTFAGVSAFTLGIPYDRELQASFAFPGPIHISMCHPGYADDLLRARDPIVERRDEERASLANAAKLPSRIWHPSRAVDGPAIDWEQVKRQEHKP